METKTIVEMRETQAKIKKYRDNALIYFFCPLWLLMLAMTQMSSLGADATYAVTRALRILTSIYLIGSSISVLYSMYLSRQCEKLEQQTQQG